MGASALYLVPRPRQQVGGATPSGPLIYLVPPLVVAAGSKAFLGLTCGEALLAGALTAPLSIPAALILTMMFVPASG